MELAVVLVVLFALAHSTPVPELPTRHLDPNEADPLRIRYLPRNDESGNIYYEDLLQDYQNAPTARASTSDVLIYLYTSNNTNAPNVLPSDSSTFLSQTNFDSSLPIFVVIHGWINNYESPLNVNVKTALLATTTANVLVVDWSSITNGLYVYSYANVQSVGEIVGDYIYSIMSTYNVSASQFYLVGHSLGAHVCGCAGARVSSLSGSLVASIVALDPAGPLFTTSNLDNRVDPGDASYVHVIHTSGGFLGLSSAIGHSDYYPNGGSRQPGCGLDLTGSCAHSRAFLYYAESIKTSNFVSYNCDSYSNYNNGNCNNNNQSLMGELYVDTSASGEYYLSTNNEPPYALG